MKLLKQSLKPIYRYLTSHKNREYIRLHNKFEKFPRYKITNVKFSGYNVFINDSMSFLNQYDEIFFKEILAFENSATSPVIYDCGSNIGMSVLYFKKLFPDSIIRAFEADIEIFNLLEQNIRNNKLEKVELMNKVVWINNDEISFGSDNAQGGSIFLNNNVRKLKAIRLKDELKKEKKIDMLKMDIEGAEFEVLKDCSDNLINIKNISLAYHSFRDQKQNLNEILSHLSENGFRYYIQNAEKNSPLLNRETGSSGMDLLVDIFAYRT